jgi:hypothetical protein
MNIGQGYASADCEINWKEVRQRLWNLTFAHKPRKDRATRFIELAACRRPSAGVV